MSAKESMHITKDPLAHVSSDVSLERTEISREIASSGVTRENFSAAQDLSSTAFSFGVERKLSVPFAVNTEAQSRPDLRLDTGTFISLNQALSDKHDTLLRAHSAVTKSPVSLRPGAGVSIFDRLMRWVERLIKSLEQRLLGQLYRRLRPGKLQKKIVVASQESPVEDGTLLRSKSRKRDKTLRL